MKVQISVAAAVRPKTPTRAKPDTQLKIVLAYADQLYMGGRGGSISYERKNRAFDLKVTDAGMTGTAQLLMGIEGMESKYKIDAPLETGVLDELAKWSRSSKAVAPPYAVKK